MDALYTKCEKKTRFLLERVFFLLNCNVEVVVYGLGQITKQRIYIVPNVIDRVIGIYGEHKVSAWGVYNADITCIADNAVRGGNVAMFVRNKRAVWNSALDQ